MNYLQAAQHFQSAANLTVEEDLNLKLAYLTRSADALVTHGDEKGNNAIWSRQSGSIVATDSHQQRDSGH